MTWCPPAERSSVSPVPASATKRSELAERVAAVITRKAKVAGMSDAAYFREIMSGRAPRITRAEAQREAPRGEETP